MTAAGGGHAETVKFLIEAEADINVQNNYGYTALYWADWWGHTEIVEILKNAGAVE